MTQILRLIAAPLLVLATLASAGCRAPESLAVREARLGLARLAYPADAEYGPDLDLVAERTDGSLRLINRTARVFRSQQLWLNQQYVGAVPVIPLGPGKPLLLERFVNTYSEPFPTGTLLAPDKARAVVLAELFDPQTGRRHRITVWPDDTEDSRR